MYIYIAIKFPAVKHTTIQVESTFELEHLHSGLEAVSRGLRLALAIKLCESADCSITPPSGSDVETFNEDI